MNAAEQPKVPDMKGEEEDAGRAYRVRLPPFVNDDEIRLGDMVMRATHRLGIHPCAGCRRRAAALNRWIVLTR